MHKPRMRRSVVLDVIQIAEGYLAALEGEPLAQKSPGYEYGWLAAIRSTTTTSAETSVEKRLTFRGGKNGGER